MIKSSAEGNFDIGVHWYSLPVYNTTVNRSSIPIIVVGFNRPNHLSSCLESLERNEGFQDHPVRIFLDGPRNEEDVNSCNNTYQVASKFSLRFSNVRISAGSSNLGVGNSILSAIDETFEDYDGAIIVEDDLILSPHFLGFCSWGLKTYQKTSRVCSIVGFSLNLKSSDNNYFMRGADCWGWATWRDRWQTFERDGSVLLDRIMAKKLQRDFDLDFSYQYTSMLERQARGQSDSWAIRWHADNFIKNKLSLCPAKSLVLNMGNDGTGTNMSKTEAYLTKLSDVRPIYKEPELVEDYVALASLVKYYESKFPQNFFRKFVNFLKRKIRFL